MRYGDRVTVAAPFADTVGAVRAALAEQGFGVLTEIDVRATLAAKLGAEFEDYLILGACNPPLAKQALDVERSVGLLLPCNVVVRADGPDRTIVEFLDPNLIATAAGEPALELVARQAAELLARVRATLTG